MSKACVLLTWAGAVSIMCLSAAAADIQVLYVVPMSHTDIGFTALPSAVSASMAVSTDDALDAAKKDPDYVWVYENFWQLKQWLDRHPYSGPVVKRLKEGRFGLSAAYATPHSSLLSDWALEQYFRIPVAWGKRHGIAMDWAVLDDVPGHPFNLPSCLAACGVHYLVIGSNQSLSVRLPRAISDTPFWWEGPDGQRVLTWISADNYVEGFERYGVPPEIRRAARRGSFTEEQRLAYMREDIGKALQTYADQGYPYDAVLVLHAFDNWGSRPSRELSATMKLWNSANESPKLQLATPREFFRHIEDESGSDLPVYRGGFGGQWEPVRTGAPTAMARARALEERLRQKRHPRQKRVEALLTYWEHTFSLGPSWPGYFTREQLVRHNREQYQLTARWPSPDTDWPHGKPAELPADPPGVSLTSNVLYYVNYSKIGPPFVPLDDAAWMDHTVERLSNGALRLRHTIDRLALPSGAQIVWAWNLAPSDVAAPIVVHTDSGPIRLSEDNILAYDPGHWIAWQGFTLGSTEFTPQRVFMFRRDPARAVLLGHVLGQSRHGVLKGGQKAALSFDEVYPGEDTFFRFAIDVTALSHE